MIQIVLFTSLAFIAGFIAAWILRSIELEKSRKLQKSTAGFLESEKLMKETLQKENVQVHQLKQLATFELEKKLKEVLELNRLMDQDILLLQKSYEETEALMMKGQPALHELKLKLIEAQNTIARYKAQSESRESDK